MRGTLYGIGVGPGDPELMTIKALRCIKKSDVIILPAEPKEDCYAYRIVQRAYPDIDRKEITCMPFLMTKKEKDLSAAHQKIYDDIAVLLKQGKSVGFLTIGDPAVYSTYSYIHEKERQNGGNPIMISGVPSFCAAAAAMGISLADGTEPIHIIPGSYDLEDTFSLKGTRVYMKSGKNLKILKKVLLEKQGEKDYLVYVVSNCGMANESIMAGAENIDEDSGYLTIVIVKERK